MFGWKKNPQPTTPSEEAPSRLADPAVLEALQRLEKAGVQLLAQMSGSEVYTTEVLGLGRDGFFVDTLSPPEGDRRALPGTTILLESLYQGITYTLETTVLGRVQFVDELPAFKLSYPTEVRQERRRRSPRLRTRGDASLSFRAPFPCDAPVVNLSQGGLAFDYDAELGRLSQGTMVRDILLELGRYPVVAVQGRVVGNLVVELGTLSLPRRYRAGLAFQSLSADAAAAVRGYLGELQPADVPS